MPNQDFKNAKKLPPYIFGQINSLKNEARSRGEDVIDFGMGNPDQPTPNAVVDKLMSDAKTAGDSAINYTTFERILASEMPVIPIYHYAGVFMLNKQLKGWPFDNVEQNWYSRNLYKIAK